MSVYFLGQPTVADSCPPPLNRCFPCSRFHLVTPPVNHARHVPREVGECTLYSPPWNAFSTCRWLWREYDPICCTYEECCSRLDGSPIADHGYIAAKFPKEKGCMNKSIDLLRYITLTVLRCKSSSLISSSNTIMGSSLTDMDARDLNSI